MKSLFLIPVVLLMLFSSCKKEDKSNANCDKTIKDIAGTYSLTKTEYAPDYGSFSEKPIPGCLAEDRFILKPDGTTEYNDLGVSCTADKTILGTWSVSSDGSKITLLTGSYLGYIKDNLISSFDCSSLVITGKNPGSTYRVTLKKQ